MTYSSINHGFTKKHSKLLNQRKQAKLQWLQNPSQTNGDNMNNICMKLAKLSGTGGSNKDKMHELETNSKNKTIKNLKRQKLIYKGLSTW
jgi:hypothetical protein